MATTPNTKLRRLRRGRTVFAFAIVLSAAAVGLSGVAGAASAVGKKNSGSVDVLSAGSLQTLMQAAVAPAFHRATGYTLNDISEGSTAIASAIKGRVQVGDVFISASPAVNATLEGKANGKRVTWYATFGKSPLLLGFDSHSKFANDLKTEPWYDVVGRPGFRLGRTDPATDPKGVLAVSALKDAARRFDKPSLLALTTSTTNVYSETSLLGELQADQLDAGFFYAVEATAGKLKTTVSLTGVPKFAADYTITVLNRAPHEAAAIAFVKFMLGSTGRAILKKNGVDPIKPAKVSGARNVPSSLRATL